MIRFNSTTRFLRVLTVCGGLSAFAVASFAVAQVKSETPAADTNRESGASPDDKASNSPGAVTKPPAKPRKANTPQPGIAKQKSGQEKTDDQSARPKAGEKARALAAKGGKPVDTPAEREAAALKFARDHHPELAVLVSPLKATNRQEYQRAIKELYRANERLNGIKLRDADRYELELNLWKVQSRVRLLAARLTMDADPMIEDQLRETLAERQQTQLKVLRYDRQTLERRLEQVGKQIERLESGQEEVVQQEFERLMKKSQRQAKAAAAKAREPVGDSSRGLAPAKSDDQSSDGRAVERGKPIPD